MTEQHENPIDKNAEQVLGSIQQPPEIREARKEEALFEEGASEQRAESGEIRRSEQYQEAVHWVRVLTITLGWILAASFALVMAIYYLGPQERLWMTAQQIDKIETALSGGVITAAILMARRIFPSN